MPKLFSILCLATKATQITMLNRDYHFIEFLELLVELTIIEIIG